MGKFMAAFFAGALVLGLLGCEESDLALEAKGGKSCSSCPSGKCSGGEKCSEAEKCEKPAAKSSDSGCCPGH